MTDRRTVAYTLAGFSPLDGLGEGRWIVIPNSGGVLRWVGEKEAPRQSAAARGECVDCYSEINYRATRCRSCAVRNRREVA